MTSAPFSLTRNFPPSTGKNKMKSERYFVTNNSRNDKRHNLKSQRQEDSNQYHQGNMLDTSSTPSPSIPEPVDDTAKWIQYLPESFGIREAVRQSKYRWCARESALWGLATGSAMSLHRLRMRSTIMTSMNFGFASFFLVYVGSYYFCVKRRDHTEKMVRIATLFLCFSWSFVFLLKKLKEELIIVTNFCTHHLLLFLTDWIDDAI